MGSLMSSPSANLGMVPASPMIVSQLLKRGTLREELELEKLRRENAVLESKKTVLDSNTNTERLMAEAISAMRSYQGDE